MKKRIVSNISEVSNFQMVMVFQDNKIIIFIWLFAWNFFTSLPYERGHILKAPQ